MVKITLPKLFCTFHISPSIYGNEKVYFENHGVFYNLNFDNAIEHSKLLYRVSNPYKVFIEYAQINKYKLCQILD